MNFMELRLGLMVAFGGKSRIPEQNYIPYRYGSRLYVRIWDTILNIFVLKNQLLKLYRYHRNKS